ncbi:MAG: GreA/GreB family elongation factor [Bacteroidota bacterium]
MELKQLKSELIEACYQQIKKKLDLIDEELDSVQQSASEDTKSSAGDKYETGREMMMLEKTKLLNQKEQVAKQLKPLQKIDVNKDFMQIETGALIKASNALYFIASSIGQVKLAEQSVFVISPLAPIAQAMLGKKKGDAFEINGNKQVILSVD